MSIMIQICPDEGVVDVDPGTCTDVAEALADCCRSGDNQEACEFVRDQVEVEFRIVARNAAGEYENRLATAAEKAEAARTIYFESESDFDDEDTADMYLVWEAAHQWQYNSENPE